VTVCRFLNDSSRLYAVHGTPGTRTMALYGL
jgi:hypothetical protein